MTWLTYYEYSFFKFSGPDLKALWAAYVPPQGPYFTHACCKHWSLNTKALSGLMAFPCCARKKYRRLCGNKETTWWLSLRCDAKIKDGFKWVFDQGLFLTVASIGEASWQCPLITAVAGAWAAKPPVECEQTQSQRAVKVTRPDARICLTVWPMDWGMRNSPVFCWDFYRRTSWTCSGSTRPVK